MGDSDAPPRKMRFAAYMGWHRWCDWRNGPERGERDHGEIMLRRLAETKHSLVAVMLRRGDCLEKTAKKLGTEVIPLPEQLCLAMRESRAFFRGGAWRRTDSVRDWFERVGKMNLDLGFVYAGGWIPQQLFSIPGHGFVNYHPGPLPELPGFFPEMFLTLRDDLPFRGTLHQVADGVDEGRVLAYTPLLRHPKHTTAKDVIARMKDACPALLERYLDGLASGRARVPAVGEGIVPLVASVANVNVHSRIRWDADSHECIERKQRCFCCSVWGMAQPLHAEIDGGTREVLAVETYAGDFPGVPGQRIGEYRGPPPFAGAPVVRTLEGATVVVPGREYEKGWRVRLPRRFVIREGRRRKRTLRSGLRLIHSQD